MEEPGLARHEWVSRYESLEEDMHDDPAGALPQLVDLVQQALEEAGYDLDDPVAAQGDEREILDEYRAARELSDRIEQGAAFDPGEVGAAARGLREVVAYLVDRRSA